MPPSLRIVVADDDAIVRAGLSTMMADLGHQVIGTADSLQSTLDIVAATEPDIALLDIRMPPTYTLEGLEAAHLIRERHRGTGVVVLSQFLAPDYALRLVDECPNGVGYLLKTDVRHADRLAAAILEVADGGTVVDSGVVERLQSRWAGRRDVDGLSERERELLALVAQGMSNRYIGETLHLSVRTVENHVASILHKLRIPHAADTNRRVRAVLTFVSGRADGLDLVL